MSRSLACHEPLPVTGACHGTTAFDGCNLVEHAERLAAQAQSVKVLRCAQTVLMPTLLGATLEQTAAALGIGRAAVSRCPARVRSRLTHPAQLDPSWGGRRRTAMSIEEGNEFLEPLADPAADSGMLIVAPLRA
jgi:hypothetical protein